MLPKPLSCPKSKKSPNLVTLGVGYVRKEELEREWRCERVCLCERERERGLGNERERQRTYEHTFEHTGESVMCRKSTLVERTKYENPLVSLD